MSLAALFPRPRFLLAGEAAGEKSGRAASAEADGKTAEFAALRGKARLRRLRNGLRLILCPRGEAPVVSCVTVTEIGEASERPGEAGFARLWAGMAFQGTPFIGGRDYAKERAAWREIAAVRRRLKELRGKLPARLREKAAELELLTAADPGFNLTDTLLRRTMQRTTAAQGFPAGSGAERRLQFFFFRLSRIAAGALPERGEHLVDLESRRRFVAGLKKSLAPLLAELKPELAKTGEELIERVGENRENFRAYLLRKEAAALANEVAEPPGARPKDASKKSAAGGGWSAKEAKEYAGALVRLWRATLKAEEQVVGGETAKLLRAVGGEGPNAFADATRTTAFVSLPVNALELWAALESDRLMNAVPRRPARVIQGLLRTEREAAAEPARRLYGLFLRAAFPGRFFGPARPARRAALLNCTRAAADAFRRRCFSARRTVIAVVGAINIERDGKMLENYFGKLPRRLPGSPALPAAEKPRGGKRKTTGKTRLEIKLGDRRLLLVGWRLPELKAPEVSALTTVAALLGDGSFSRLNGRLTASGAALSVAAWPWPIPEAPKLLCAAVEPAPGTTIADVKKALEEETARLRKESPRPEELRRLVIRKRAELCERLRSHVGLAQALCDYELFGGGWKKLFDAPRRLRALTPADIQRAAARFLVENAELTAELEPEPGAGGRVVLGVRAESPDAADR